MPTAADTAFSIAVVRAEESSLPAEERLFDDPYAALFAAGGAHVAEATQRFLALPLFRELVRLRTRFIDDVVREGLAVGISQVVLLGAGFDARAMRLPEIAARRAAVYEVDLAGQLERKCVLLAAGGVATPAHVAYVPCDFMAPRFEEALGAGLTANGFRAGAGAIFVWEGVIPYIGRAEADRSLAFMARVGGAGTRAAFEFAATLFEPETAEAWTRRNGFTSCRDVGCDELWRRHLRGEPPPFASVCRMGEALI
jgi:methyltransferase (TIGR00027 family)